MNEYELYHFGIPGMSWGKRNGPPYPLSRSEHNQVVKKASRREKKDARYKEREIGKIDKHYNKQLNRQNSKLNKYTEALKSTTDERKAAKVESKIDRRKAAIKAIEQQRQREIDAVRRMSHKDIRREKLVVGANKVATVIRALDSLNNTKGNAMLVNRVSGSYLKRGMRTGMDPMELLVKYATPVLVPTGVLKLGKKRKVIPV